MVSIVYNNSAAELRRLRLYIEKEIMKKCKNCSETHVQSASTTLRETERANQKNVQHVEKDM